MTDFIELPQIVSSVPGPESLRLAERLADVESPDTTFLSPEFPIFWERGHGCIVCDVDGNSYLDATSSFGALSVGHTHPAVVEAVQRQAAALMHGMGDVHPSRVKVELLERIAQHIPMRDPRVILGQSGSEAVEAALKTALLATGKPGVIAFHGGYHGLTYGALEPTGRDMFRAPFAEQRGRFARHLPYGCDIELVREALGAGDIPVGAVIVEPIQGRGGIRIPAPGWLNALRDACQEAGALLILDEIYTGWGRTGTLFAFQREQAIYADFTPDILCIGKAMGGGMPISACVGARGLIESAWPKSTGEALHTSTFLGHPTACAGAIAAIDVIVGENLASRAEISGAYLIDELRKLGAQYPQFIRDVRGQGLMLGIELVDFQAARDCMLNLLRGGAIVLLAGDLGNVVELTPPLIIHEEQIVWLISSLTRYFAKL